MAGFRYPYQKIVDLKTSEKTQAEWMLSAAIGRLQAEEMSLADLEAEKTVWLERFHSAAVEIIPLAELVLIQDYLGYLETCIARKLDEVRLAKTDVELKQHRLQGRMMDEKVWLKAKEKALVRFRHAMAIKEQNELDEIATSRFAASAQ